MLDPALTTPAFQAESEPFRCARCGEKQYRVEPVAGVMRTFCRAKRGGRVCNTHLLATRGPGGELRVFAVSPEQMDAAVPELRAIARAEEEARGYPLLRRLQRLLESSPAPRLAAAS